MTTRSDVKVDFLESPRIIEVEAPSTEITMQDLVDTLRIKEENFTGMPFEKLTNASGKEDLGGGVLVGITVDLQNAQLAFEARRDPAETGTVTTGSGTPVGSPLGPTFNFVDTNADFIAAGVQRGSLAINFTDMSIADVIEVVSATELRTRVLVNGSDNTWQIGDQYHVYNITQCNATGGNLVAVDENGDRITSVFPTAFVQVVRTASSSATLQEQLDIQFASFNGGVTVDLSSIYSGTLFPNGTARQPVNNFTDALAIANERGFSRLYIIGDATFDSSLDFAGFDIIGESQSKSTFTIDPSANVTNSEFSFATIQGTLDGGNSLTECILNGVNYIDGVISRCILEGTQTLSGLETAHFLDCYSGIPGTSTPVIDFQGSGASLAMRNYNGGIQLANKTGAGAVSIDMNSGQVKIGNDVTNGTIVLRGVGRWTDKASYTAGATVIDQLIKVDDVEQASFNGRVSVDVLNGVSGTAYPIGTEANPVNNMTDAASIAATRGIDTFHFRNSATIGNEADWTGFIFEGHTVNGADITFLNTAITDKIEVRNIQVAGIITGDNVVIKDAILDDITLKNGVIERTSSSATITLTGTSTDNFRLVDCYGNCVLDCGGDGPNITTTRFAGSLSVGNKTGFAVLALTLMGCALTLENTITTGLVFAAGVANITNNMGAGPIFSNLVTTENQGIIDTLNSNLYDGNTFQDVQKFLLAMANGRIVETSSGVFQFYEQDNTTVAFTLTKAGNERTRS